MKKKTNWIKNLIMVIIFISVITQLNIVINDGIKLAVAKYKENKINKEKIFCPPDICTVNNEEKTGKVEFEIVELPPLPPIK